MRVGWSSVRAAGYSAIACSPDTNPLIYTSALATHQLVKYKTAPVLTGKLHNI